jgi:DNA-binding CsgD family transcriptional regulator
MRLSLTPSELDRLTELVKTLHAPFDFPNVDAWRHAANHHARLLLDAHKVVFMMPGLGHAPVYCQRLDPEAAQAYVAYYHQFDVAGRLALERSMPVSSLVELHGYDAYYKSEYYNDFMGVWGCYHSLGMTAAMDVEPGFAYMAVLRDSYEDPPFDARTRVLMRLVLPAFRAGVRTYLSIAGERAILASVLDMSEKRLLLCDDRGEPAYTNVALERTLAADGERPALEQHMRDLARSVGELGGNGKSSHHVVGRTGERKVATRRGCYRLSATLAREAGPTPAGVLVLLEPLFREPLSDDDLRQRYGLTMQEIRVARRIADRQRNNEIAHALGISVHTTRRHTERVLEKMGIASRAQVAERISRG